MACVKVDFVYLDERPGATPEFCKTCLIIKSEFKGGRGERREGRGRGERERERGEGEGEGEERARRESERGERDIL